LCHGKSLHAFGVSHKSEKIAKLIESCQGKGMDAHYLGYFECFNRQLFYEAHDVLEELWLPQKHGPSGNFYKGLIQLAGAFVHLQKARPGPAAALFKLSRENLKKYPAVFERFEMASALSLIEEWLGKLEGREGSDVSCPLPGTPRLGLT
jgi:predicted metal-dependent hydrolase